VTGFHVSDPFSALTLLVGRQEVIRPVKKLGVGLVVMICTAYYLQLSPPLPSSFASLNTG